MPLIDLTHPLEHGQPTFAWDPKLSIIPHGTTQTLKYNITQITMGSHQGTHLDAMYHFLDDGKTIDAMPLDWFYGETHVLRIPKQAGEELRVEDFEPYADVLQPGAKVIYETGWHHHFGADNFFSEFPSLTLEAGQFLADRGIRMLGMDTPTPSQRLVRDPPHPARRRDRRRGVARPPRPRAGHVHVHGLPAAAQRARRLARSARSGSWHEGAVLPRLRRTRRGRAARPHAGRRARCSCAWPRAACAAANWRPSRRRAPAGRPRSSWATSSAAPWRRSAPGVTGVAVGARVVSHSLVPCGDCVRCRRGDTHLCAHRQIFGMHRAGAFAEFVAVPAHALMDWPEGLPAEAACLAEPLANGVHMVHLTAWLRPQTVLVIGAGPIGLMAQQAFAAMTGAEVVVADLSPHRRAVAEGLGARRVFDPRAEDPVAVMHALTNGEGADVVIDAVGMGLTKRQSIAAARPGGAAVWIGLHEDAVTLDTYPVTLPERHVLGTYAATQSELAEALALMADGRVDVTSWPTVFPLDEGVTAFHRMLAAEGADLKAVLVP